jgi:CRISPR/Cas system-associated protein Cas10 (large subunit of type III CRISPR-Cas system)
MEGGAGSDEPVDLRERLDRFRARLPNEAPRIYAGPSAGGNTCAVCGRNITPGATEYEAEFSTGVFVLDRACFVLWQQESR